MYWIYVDTKACDHVIAQNYTLYIHRCKNIYAIIHIISIVSLAIKDGVVRKWGERGGWAVKLWQVVHGKITINHGNYGYGYLFDKNPQDVRP